MQRSNPAGFSARSANSTAGRHSGMNCGNSSKTRPTKRSSAMRGCWSIGPCKKTTMPTAEVSAPNWLGRSCRPWTAGIQRPRSRDYRSRAVKRSELLPLLIQAFVALDELTLVERLIAFVSGRPKEFDLTTIQVPAWFGLEKWLKRNVKQSAPPIQHWLTKIVEELEVRKSQPPREPTDWRRESATGCNCADCKELSRFLEDSQAQTLRLPLAENRRRHLHNVIDKRKLDTTHTTERRGRPYTLVCSKTKASYERALKAYHVDLEHLAKMRQLLEWHEGLPANRGRLTTHRTTTSKGRKR